MPLYEGKETDLVTIVCSEHRKSRRSVGAVKPAKHAGARKRKGTNAERLRQALEAATEKE